MAFNGTLTVSTKRANGDIWASPSQLDTFSVCKRKWYYKHVLGLTEPMKGSTTFGTVLHGVVERYLRADDLGRDAAGRPVDLYPSGWDEAVERDGQRQRVTVAEQARIRKLVDAAIEAGYLARRPNRYVEFEFKKYPIINAGGWQVYTVGKVDLLEPDVITDHKTVGKMRYAASPGKLKGLIQMNLYAKIGLEFYREQGIYTPDPIQIRHIAYCKDEDDIRVREIKADLSELDIQTYWNNRIVPAATEMLSVRQAKDASEIPDPSNMSEACNAYGGCAFLSICGGRETADTYQRRLAYAAANPPGGQKVNFAQMLGGQQPPQQPQQSQQRPSAPWYFQGCTACSNNPVPGFNSNGDPCRICDGMQAQAKGITSDRFHITGKGEQATWTPKDSVAALPGSAGPLQGTGGQAQTQSVEAHHNPTIPQAQPPAQWQGHAQPQAQQGPPVQQAPMPPQGQFPLPPAQPQVPQWQGPPVQQWQGQPQVQAQQGPPAQPQQWQQQPQWAQQPPPAPQPQQTQQQYQPPIYQNSTEREMDSAAAVIASPKKSGPGRPRNGVTLYLGCAPVKGDTKGMQSLDGVYSQVCDEIARVNGRPFAQVDPETRRTMLCQFVPWLVKNWGSNVKLTGGMPRRDDVDFTIFVQRLREHVDNVIEAGVFAG